MCCGRAGTVLSLIGPECVAGGGGTESCCGTSTALTEAAGCLTSPCHSSGNHSPKEKARPFLQGHSLWKWGPPACPTVSCRSNLPSSLSCPLAAFSLILPTILSLFPWLFLFCARAISRHVASATTVIACHCTSNRPKMFSASLGA